MIQGDVCTTKSDAIDRPGAMVVHYSDTLTTPPAVVGVWRPHFVTFLTQSPILCFEISS